MVVELRVQRTIRDCGRTARFSSPPLFRWLVEWCLLLGICNIVICGYIEIVEQQACYDNEFRLTCPSLDTHVAILEATFTPENSTEEDDGSLDSNFTRSCSISYSQLSYPHTASERYTFPRKIIDEDRSTERNLRGPISHRCSGVNHCSFILNLDHNESRSWGPGFVYIKYACMDGSRVTKFCNEEVQVGEGFVQTPGYPRYYVGDGSCRWLLRAPKGQAVRLSVLDLSLRSIGPYENDCLDRLSIQDGSSGRLILSTCEQVDTPLVLVSEGETLDILVKTKSKKMFPKRGVLLHYKALGCVSPPAPRDGYLVYREGGRAQYMCCVGHAFPDTRRRERTLLCLRDNAWDDILPDCIKISGKIWDGNGTYVVDNTPQYSNTNKNPNTMLIDIVIPSIIIAALFIGNAFIVLIIFKYRKRKDQEIGENEEFTLVREASVRNGRATHECNEDMTDAV